MLTLAAVAGLAGARLAMQRLHRAGAALGDRRVERSETIVLRSRAMGLASLNPSGWPPRQPRLRRQAIWRRSMPASPCQYPLRAAIGGGAVGERRARSKCATAFGGAFRARRDPKDIDAEKSQRRQLRPEIHNVLALYLDPIDVQDGLPSRVASGKPLACSTDHPHAGWKRASHGRSQVSYGRCNTSGCRPAGMNDAMGWHFPCPGRSPCTRTRNAAAPSLPRNDSALHPLLHRAPHLRAPRSIPPCLRLAASPPRC